MNNIASFAYPGARPLYVLMSRKRILRFEFPGLGAYMDEWAKELGTRMARWPGIGWSRWRRRHGGRNARKVARADHPHPQELAGE